MQKRSTEQVTRIYQAKYNRLIWVVLGLVISNVMLLAILYLNRIPNTVYTVMDTHTQLGVGQIIAGNDHRTVPAIASIKAYVRTLCSRMDFESDVRILNYSHLLNEANGDLYDHLEALKPRVISHTKNRYDMVVSDPDIAIKKINIEEKYILLEVKATRYFMKKDKVKTSDDVHFMVLLEMVDPIAYESERIKAGRKIGKGGYLYGLVPTYIGKPDGSSGMYDVYFYTK